MKKIFSVVLVALFLVGLASMGYSESYEAKNAVILAPFGGPEGISPATEIVRVRYGRMCTDPQTDETIASGDVLIWDCNSSDGITISRSISDVPTGGFAGVAVTTIQTSDSVTVRGSDRSWGYMLIRGYGLAKIDTSESTTGGELVQNGATRVASFGTVDLAGGSAGQVSQDIGTLLRDTGTDGLMRVWIR
jgi:hypothetical protein